MYDIKHGTACLLKHALELDASWQVFVEKVDVVSGVGYDRAAALGRQSARFHDLRRVISNLGVFDFATPDRRMRLVSVHPGVAVEQVVKARGFELVIPREVPETRLPSDAELALIRERIDPEASRTRKCAPSTERNRNAPA